MITKIEQDEDDDEENDDGGDQVEPHEDEGDKEDGGQGDAEGAQGVLPHRQVLHTGVYILYRILITLFF